MEADVSVPCVDAAAPDVGCVLPGEENVSFLFGLKGVLAGLGSSWSSSSLPDGENMTVSWDAGMDSATSTTSCSVAQGWVLVAPLLV